MIKVLFKIVLYGVQHVTLQDVSFPKVMSTALLYFHCIIATQRPKLSDNSTSEDLVVLNAIRILSLVSSRLT